MKSGLKSGRIIKVVEMTTIFIALPVLYYFNLLPGHKSLPLLVVFIYCLIWLFQNKKFGRKKMGIKYYTVWKKMFIRIVFIGILIYGTTYFLRPDLLFNLPKNEIKLWIMIMIFYPIWSAFPQELIYRCFFFERYADIFPDKRIMISLNILLFSFLHIIFRNPIAVIGSLIVGTLWAITYQRNQSLLAVSIEHAIIGDLVYTFGLGYYFYVPDF